MYRQTVSIVLLMLACCWQDALGQASVEKFGHLTVTAVDTVVYNPARRAFDTLQVTKSIEWNTAAGTARKRREAQRGASRRVAPSDFTDGQNSSWSDMYWFRYLYPSTGADGQPIVLSALAAFPDEDPGYTNNVIVGCHVTITSNKEAPSEYYKTGSWMTDVGMLMWHASSGMTIHKSESDPLYYDLVIMPDYEGYGVTKDVPHPYLNQEVTARQVTDATRYGIALYQESPVISDYRNPMRPDWKTVTVGYSQGGSVALATHRFIEQNGLDEELHFAGSVCGDGPYDPIAHMRYYINNNDGLLNMPVVLPLILKGLIESSPYMNGHRVEEYLEQDFIDTGILQWIDDKCDPEKEKTTDDVTKALKQLYKDDDSDGRFRRILNSDGTAYIDKLVTPAVYEYFSNAANFEALPTERGVCEDLHLALESNNLTRGWQPRRPVKLWHYTSDTVVPYVNAESAVEGLGPNCTLYTAGSGIDISWDHVGGGTVFFTGLNVGKSESDMVAEILKSTAFGNEDGIQPSFAEAAQQGVWFTLDGRRLSSAPTTKGVYIRDGKCILLK